jgi:signal peptidase I
VLRQVGLLLLWVGLALLLRWAVIEPRWIPSGSMLPTLQLNDRVLVEKLRARLHRPLPVGTIVVFHPPDALLAAGYDPDDGQLFRNGQPVPEPWRAEPIAYELAPLAVPPDCLLVMGDNRNASLDSHLWGPLPADHVIGTAVFRYWPWNKLGPIRFSPSAAMG